MSVFLLYLVHGSGGAKTLVGCFTSKEKMMEAVRAQPIRHPLNTSMTPGEEWKPEKYIYTHKPLDCICAAVSIGAYIEIANPYEAEARARWEANHRCFL